MRVVTPSTGNLALSQNKSASYLVRPGDTLGGIAQRHGVSLQALLASNPSITNPDDIKAGQQLALPDGAKAPQAGGPGGLAGGALGGNLGGMSGPKKPQDKFGGMGGRGGLGGALGGGKAPELSDVPGFKKLSEPVQQRLEGLQARGGFDRAGTFKLASSKGFQSLTPAQQLQTLEVFDVSDAKGKLNLAAAADRQVNGRSALLDKDKDGHTTLDNLQKMAREPVNAEFYKTGTPKNALLGQIIGDIAEPGSIRQDSKGTCTVTSMQYALARNDPGEYARLQQGLHSPQGDVQMRNGDTLSRDAGTIPPDTATDRSTTSRVFQAAMMEYSNGKLIDYDNAKDQHTSQVGTGTALQRKVGRFLGADPRRDGGSGLGADEKKRGLDALFGGDHKILSDVDALKDAKPGDQVGFRWGDGGHAVAFDHIEGDRVFIRNPWGPRSDAAGTAYEGPPPRRLEDPRTGIESMSMADARKYMHSVIL